MNVWKSWAESKGLNDNIFKYDAKELDKCLPRFFAEIRKSDCSDYEPDSPTVMLTALHRHLKQNDSKIFIVKDREFLKCRQALERKARALRVKNAMENGQMQQKYLPFKMKSSDGKTVRTKSKVTPLYSLVSAQATVWSSGLPRAS